MKARKQEAPTLENDIDEMRVEVLDLVTEEHFDRAIFMLQKFLEQPSEFPEYKQRMSRYVNHCIDLINAIKAKKHFPGKANLTRAKQQELVERSKMHFTELEDTLVKIEKALLQLMKEDVRSTLWFIRALTYSAGVLAILGFVLDVTNGLWGVVQVVTDDALERFINWLFRLL